MKKQFKYHKISMKKKRIISAITASVMFMASLPMSDISDGYRKLHSWLNSSISAFAEDYSPKYNIAEIYNASGEYSISTWQQLIDYSQSYYEWSNGNPNYTSSHKHDEDTIIISISGTGDTAPHLQNFESLGSNGKPFKGKLLFNSNSFKILNLDVPLFDELYDSTPIALSNDQNTAVDIVINRADEDAVNEPLLARKVLKSDDDPATKSDWKITSNYFDDELLVSYSGVIGEIAAKANVKLSFTNNAKADGGTRQASVISSVASQDVGVLCGKMNANATLEATYSGSNTNFYVESGSGNAGLFVGSMATDSNLTVSTSGRVMANTSRISALDGYAGGLVGKNEGGTVDVKVTVNSVDSPYTIDQYIIGKSGSGGLYGYYSKASGDLDLDVSKYTLDPKLSVTTENSGFCGGLVGEMVNGGGKLTVKTTNNERKNVNSTHSASGGNGVRANCYGGLFGSYEANALSDTLSITGITATPHNTLGASYYGGAIGRTANENPAYISFDTFTLTSAAGSNSGTVAGNGFGGLIGHSNYGYIYAKNITIGASSSSKVETKGGALVGTLNHGVLGMTGTINLTNADTKSGGVIVGSRDNTLVYAESGWTYTRPTNSFDNIGSWGDVLCFTSTLTKASVFTETNHAITMLAADATNIQDVDDYARVSLLFQINMANSNNNNKVMSNNNGITCYPAATNLTFTDDIDLTGTYLKGITRDGSSSHTTYSGTVTGGDHTIKLDFRNVGSTGASTDVPIYRHTLLGLFGIASDATINNLKFDGKILSQPAGSTTYVGALAGQVGKSFTASSCETKSTLDITVNGGNIQAQCGRLVGEATVISSTQPSSINITSCIIDGTLKGSNSNADSCFGGVIGKIYHTANAAADWQFNTVTIRGTVQNTSTRAAQKIAGLVSNVEAIDDQDVGSYKSRKITLNGVTVEGLQVKAGSSTTSMGGLLGYDWPLTDVQVTSLTVQDKAATETTAAVVPTVDATGATLEAAGLVYRATGHWVVNSITISDIDFASSSLTSLGLLVNKGYYWTAKTDKAAERTSAIYLEFPAGYTYTVALNDDDHVSSADVYDEIVAYTSFAKADDQSTADVMKNGQGVVSISTGSTSHALVMEKTNGAYTSSLSYAAQTTKGHSTSNSHTRYYYNLDKIDADVATPTTASDKLMSWGVRQYACNNIKQFFHDTYSNGEIGTAVSDSFDMKGYSWYPIDLETSVTLNGTFKLYNEEFDGCEDKKTNNKWKSLDNTDQHYMIQNGLFYNASSSITVGSIKLQGNIGAVDDNGTGFLVYKTISGVDDKNITTVSSTSGSIILDGAKINNLSSHSGYAPLLINQASNYVTLNINGVSTTSAYKDTTLGTTPDAATSLIGNAGTSASSQYINVKFSSIKLDARSAENTPSDIAETTYWTTKSIFSRATLLEKLQFDAGSSGVYDYTYAEDWGTGSGSAPHTVTYGKEVGYTESDTTTQFPGQEQMYSGEKAAGTNRYTDYVDGSATGSTTYANSFKTDFLPYVKDVSLKAYLTTEKKNQLQVNHQASEVIDGCGTYNDPYIITNAVDLAKVSRWTRGDFKNGDPINIPKDGAGSDWCANKTSTSPDYHKTYYYSNGNFYPNSDYTGTSITKASVISHLNGAYYEIISTATTENLTIDPNGTNWNAEQKAEIAGFNGLGSSANFFHGVIEGNDKTVTNKTEYPLIAFSSGSVVRRMTVVVDKSFTLNAASDSYSYPDANNRAYGAIMGQVLGGDNIIDKSYVSFGTSVITVAGKKAQLEPVGGYVGVIYNGGVIFKNLSGTISGLGNSNVNCNYVGSDNPQITGFQANRSTMIAKMTASDSLLWLYINPYVGRVINGYAVNEVSNSVGYKAAHGDCMLDNGNKNYSITNITSGSTLSVDTDDMTIEVPDAQAFFLMSVIVNSGMGANGLGYAGITAANSSTTTFPRRTADYDEIGTNDSAADCQDYDDYAKNDKASTTATPYIIAKYAPNAGTLGSTSGWEITLTGSSYTLPDGFRGIGNFYQNHDNYLLNVSSFDGKGKTIAQNTVFYTYDDGDSSFDKSIVLTTERTGGTYGNPSPDAGLGLFNAQTTNGATYTDFTLSGNVKFDVIDHKTGTSITYSANNINKNNVLSVGALFGCLYGYKTYNITNVALVNININSAKNAGGLIGYIPTDKDNADRLKLTIDTTKDSSGISITSGLNAGGLIARSYSGYISIDFHEKKFALTKIECKSTVNATSDQYGYGVGGIIGTLRAGSGSPAPEVSISNVTIGDENATKPLEIKCSVTNCGLNTGGLIGIINRASPTMRNCHVYNVSVSSNGSSNCVGGAFGHVRTESKVTIIDSSIISNIENEDDRPVISGKNYCGGFLGHSQNDTLEFIVQRSSIEGYDISGKYTGGIVGERYTKNNKPLQLENFSIINCSVAGTDEAGGIAGKQGAPLNGYNVLAKNLEVTVGSGTKKGYIAGDNISVIKLVGFSRLEKIEDGETSTLLQNMVGNGKTYGTNGYVIFADYKQASQAESGVNKLFSTITNGATNVAPYEPYVTINPSTTLGTSGYFLTGDGVSEIYKSGVKRSTAVLEQIQYDITNTVNGRYTSVTSANLDSIVAKMSTFKEEMGTTKTLADGIDFPVLIVDSTSRDTTTTLINNYISALTNTSGYNFAYNVSNVYQTVVKRVDFGSDGKTVTISDDPTLQKHVSGNSSYTQAAARFWMDPKNTDTIADYAQFNLIDVQFFDPSEPTKVAYHLYVPVYVRKLLEYDFDVHIESGTDYKINPASSLVGNTLIENMGSTVTLEFVYTYNRTAAEWVDAINNGDTVRTNFAKTLSFRSSSADAHFPADTKMVLIDTQNSSKAYYLDSLTSTAYPDGRSSLNEKILKLSQFTDGTSGFQPVILNDLMTIKLVQDNSNGTLVCTDDLAATDDYPVIVVDNSTDGAYKGKSFRTLPSDSQDSYTKYRVESVTFKNGGEKLSEHYFLSIYTKYSEASATSENPLVFHYGIQAPTNFENGPYPSRVTTASQDKASHLIMGYLYNNTVRINSLKVGDSETNYAITKSNNQIVAEIEANVELTQSGKDNLMDYLKLPTPPEIYQSLLIKFNKKEGSKNDIGIHSISKVVASDYNIGGDPITELKPQWTNEEYTKTTSNYIELQNDYSISNKLYRGDGSVTISAKATMTFDPDKDMAAQFFPYSPIENRTYVYAYSNVSSNSSQTAFSKVSAKDEDSAHAYYTDIEERAKLTYDAKKIGDNGYLPQLGINYNEIDNSNDIPSPIQTVGKYDLSDFKASEQLGRYLKCEIELRCKDDTDEYTQLKTISQYLEESSFSILNGVTPIRVTKTDTKWTFIYDRQDTDLEEYYSDYIYQIPIDFKVYTGAEGFESSNRRYGNYGVYLYVSLLPNLGSTTPVTKSDPDPDYVKYTNARIYLGRVNPNKSS